MDDQAKAAEDAVMEDPQVKADQAKLEQDIEAARAKQRAADEARQKEEEAKAARAAHEFEAAREAAAEHVAPTPGEMAEKQRAENLDRARANGYRDPDPVHPVDRVKAVLTAMEHAIKHNAPVSLEMIRELRDVLGVHDEPPADSETE